MPSDIINYIPIARPKFMCPLNSLRVAKPIEPILYPSENSTITIKKVEDTFENITEDYYKQKAKLSDIRLNKNEQKLYNTLSQKLDKKYKDKLSFLLKTGILNQTKAENNATILESLYKIITTPRYKGIDGINVLKECIDIMENPSIITQFGEDIPDDYKDKITNTILTEQKESITKIWMEENFNTEAKTSKSSVRKPTDAELKKYIHSQLENRHISTCAAAALEYDIATKHSAEFFRLIESFTSENPQTTKKYNFSIGNFNYITAVFKPEYELIDNNTANITIKPDKNAMTLAVIQNNHKDEKERSIIDILMQSMIMNLGSGGTYNSLTDSRETNNFTKDNKGLVEMELSFAKEVLTGNHCETVNYTTYTGKKYVLNRTKEEIKKEITEAIDKNQNVVVGYIWENGNNGEYSGHEITIIDKTTNSNGENFFVCQDSDDCESKPVVFMEDFLLSHIHHASYNRKRTNKFSNPNEGRPATNRRFLFTLPQMVQTPQNILTPVSTSISSPIFTPFMQSIQGK